MAWERPKKLEVKKSIKEIYEELNNKLTYLEMELQIMQEELNIMKEERGIQ